ncbi:hypothetical protein D3C86_1572130 [compost metagenome]
MGQEFRWTLGRRTEGRPRHVSAVTPIQQALTNALQLIPSKGDVAPGLPDLLVLAYAASVIIHGQGHRLAQPAPLMANDLDPTATRELQRDSRGGEAPVEHEEYFGRVIIKKRRKRNRGQQRTRHELPKN